MKQLPGDVFIGPQIMTGYVQTLAETGVVSIINNRPDMEVSTQPLSDKISDAAAKADIKYAHIPMSGGLTPKLIDAAVEAYKTLPRPIFAYCASGMRSTALWCFAHVDQLGVDGVLDAASDAGYSLEQIRSSLTQFLESRGES